MYQQETNNSGNQKVKMFYIQYFHLTWEHLTHNKTYFIHVTIRQILQLEENAKEYEMWKIFIKKLPCLTNLNKKKNTGSEIAEPIMYKKLGTLQPQQELDK